MANQFVRSKIKQARKLFSQDSPIPEGLLRPEIQASWERSRSYGLEFSKADKRLISATALKERCAERRELLDVAIPVMERLYDFAAGSGCMYTLCDEEGYMLKAMGDDEIMEVARKNKFMEGCNRHERRLGTNGIGTPLVTHEPIQVFAEEHFYELHYQWVCSGAPIFDPSGKPVGVFCVTGLFDKVSYHTLGLAAAAADSITQQIAMKQAYNAIERIQQRMKVIVETVPTGILLCNHDLEIIQSNTRASALLMLPEREVIGKKLHELLGRDPIDPVELHAALDDKDITIERDGVPLHFIFTLNAANTNDYVVTFVKTESFHKKVRRVIGSEAYFTFDDIVGRVPALQNAVSLARIAADNNATVLLTGESGTGKELFAQSIHNGSRRKNGPFVALNCAALPKSLIESELFGYEAGSFTGARREGSAGKFELANGGTIFLDEIGDMPLDVQASLLRVLQNREVSRIGSTKATKIDVRIIAASNRNLQEMIRTQDFRADLYYRLNVLKLRLPPLRECLEDIGPMVKAFLMRHTGDGKLQTRLTPKAVKALMRHGWPGNVRELRNFIERLAVIYNSRTVTDAIIETMLAEDLDGYEPAQVPGTPGDTDIQEIQRVLSCTNGNYTKAARLLGISRITLWRKLKNGSHGVSARNGFGTGSAE